MVKNSSCPIGCKISRYHVIFTPPYQTCFSISSMTSEKNNQTKLASRKCNDPAATISSLMEAWTNSITMLFWRVAVSKAFAVIVRASNFLPPSALPFPGSLHMRRAVTSPNNSGCGDKELSCHVSALITECAVF